MELNTTKQDMLERFRLYGEIYCTLAEIEEDDGTMDYFKLEDWEIEEMLENEKVNLIFDFGDEKGELYELNFEEDMLMVFYTSNKDELTKGCPIIHIPTKTIRKLKDLLEKICKSIEGGRSMKRKDIEKAAGDYSGSSLGFTDNNSVMAKHKAFVDGAEWRINIVWHDASEMPEKKFALVEYDCFPKGHGYLVVPDAREVIESITRWAYIEDLISNKEE